MILMCQSFLGCRLGVWQWETLTDGWNNLNRYASSSFILFCYLKSYICSFILFLVWSILSLFLCSSIGFILVIYDDFKFYYMQLFFVPYNILLSLFYMHLFFVPYNILLILFSFFYHTINISRILLYFRIQLYVYNLSKSSFVKIYRWQN